jgi:HlyD family secretion protein
MKIPILPSIALTALTLGIVSVIRSQPKREITAPSAPPPESPYAHNVAAVGLIESSTENIAVGSPLADVVAEVAVVAGQSVKAGDALFKLDDRQRRADLDARRADLAVARSQVSVDAAILDDATRQLGFAASLSDQSAISQEEITRRRSAVATAQARFDAAKAQVLSAEAQVEVAETQIERGIVRAPVDGEVLQVKIHPGEFAPAGITETPLVLLGRADPLNVRVDVDEFEAWRVRPDAAAVAQVRGNSNLKTRLTFVRFEPYVLPKRSLTGDNTERVDTRVLQVIYRVEDRALPLFVGQQMDVFIDAPGVAAAVAQN